MNLSVGDDRHNSTSLGSDPQQQQQHSYDHLAQDIVLLVFYLCTTILGLFGNSIVCYVVYKKRVITTTYILIANLAISDILGSLTIPSQWILCSYYAIEEYGDRMCGLTKSSQMLSYFISTFTMTVIAFDRYRIVYYPLGVRMKPWLPIALIWILSTVCVLPTMVSMRISEYFSPNRLIYCRIVFPSTYKLFAKSPFRKFRATLVMVTQYAIPLTVSIVLYSLCMKKIIARKRIGAVTDQQSKEFYRSKRRTIKMLTIALLAFAIVWLPVHLIHIIDFYITPLLANDCNSSIVYIFFYWLAISSCCFNPFIYCYLNNDFRSAAKTVLFCRYNQNQTQSQDLLQSKSSKSSRQSSNTGSAIFYTNSST